MLDREGKSSNWITMIDRKFTEKGGARDLKTARSRGKGSTRGREEKKKVRHGDISIYVYILISGF